MTSLTEFIDEKKKEVLVSLMFVWLITPTKEWKEKKKNLNIFEFMMICIGF